MEEFIVGDVVEVSDDSDTFTCVITSVKKVDGRMEVDYQPVDYDVDDEDGESDVVAFGPAMLCEKPGDMGNLSEFGLNAEDFEFPLWQHEAYDGTVTVNITKKEQN